AALEGAPSSAQSLYHGNDRRDGLWTHAQGSNHADLPQVLKDRRSEVARVDTQELPSRNHSYETFSAGRSAPQRHRGSELHLSRSQGEKGVRVSRSLVTEKLGRRRIL